jgi:hypothetical protein
MDRLPTVTRLALRELWITYRLVLIVGLPVLAGLLLQAVPLEATELGPVGGAGHWLAVGLAVAFSVIGAMAAATIAAERRRGTMGWLVVRAVPRSGVLIGWFAAFGLPLAGGLGVGATATWFGALERTPTIPDALPFTVASAAMLAVGLASIATGLLFGLLLRPLPAFALTLTVCAAFLGLSVMGPFPDGLPPVAVMAVLGDLERGTTPVAQAVRGAGIALAASAALLLLASAVTERLDL